MDELVDAGVAPFGLVVAGSSGQEHTGNALVLECPCGVGGLGGTAVVAAADDCHGRTRRLGGPDAGDGEQVGGERGAG